MPPRTRRYPGKLPTRASKRLNAADSHHQGHVPSSAPLPNFLTRLPPEVGSIIYHHIKVSASRSDIFSLCCTSETTYFTFIPILYDTVRLSARNVQSFFGDLCTHRSCAQPVSILCPRPGLEPEVIQSTLPYVSLRLLRKLVNFNPYFWLLAAGRFTDTPPTPQQLESTSSLFKKIILCLSIKKIIIEDLAACQAIREFSRLVRSRFLGYPLYEPGKEQSITGFVSFAFKNVEWLVLGEGVTKDMEACFDHQTTMERRRRVREMMQFVDPCRICAWSFKDVQTHSIFDLGLESWHGKPLLKQFVLHNTRYFCAPPAECMKYYLRPGNPPFPHGKPIANSLAEAFAKPSRTEWDFSNFQLVPADLSSVDAILFRRLDE
ncbi:hypothetical protein I350_06665 [Cryptococcus amylolentus CBS 6273]|uniref:Uncharacterized protein n=1 Tax=Cryptococcus amylolentus CBS 6273 TaxID=1296118 RepID=A0A1E3JJC9_9TREE|nr:hypothetical protein I350_06665 [Cryptococcus amylolentus CBS 6273]